MNLKAALGTVLVVVVLAGAWVWYERTHLPAETAPLQEEFDWSFVDLGTAASTTPQTNVTLTIAGIPALSLGAFSGSCFAVAGSQAPLLTGELSGVICLWNGTGEEIGVFQNTGTSTLELEEGSVVGTDSAHLTSRSGFVALSKQL